jgi:predicted nuclease of predicted toxin-antitoxin system
VKLLFDQNLSHKLVSLLADAPPGSQHVRNLGMKEAADHEIAAWLQLPNCKTSRVQEVLRRHANRVRHFWDDPRSTLLTIM